MSSTYSSITSSISDVVSSFKTIKSTKEETVISLNSLEKAAQTLENKAESTLSKDRLVNTARRARMADSVESEARKQLALSKTIFRLIEGIKAGETTYLSKVRTKTQVEILQYTINYAKNRRASKLRLPEWETKNKPVQKEDAEYASYPYPWLDIYSSEKLFDLSKSIIELDEPLSKLKVLTCFDSSKAITFDSPQKLQLLEVIIKEIKANTNSDASRLLEGITASMADYQRLCQIGIPDLATLIEALKEYCHYCSDIPKEDPVKRLERDLVGCKIPGYFPTPKVVVERMLQLAHIEPGMTILEPSSGKGNIVDLIKLYHPTCSLSVIEINHTLRQILKAKGYNLVGTDFLEHKERYSLVLMNPPFDQDIKHVRHAYSLLNSGGRLVAIMSESPFFRMDKESIAFRNWLDEVNGTSEKLPDGSFLESERSTGVAARIIVIDKASSTSNIIIINTDSIDSIDSINAISNDAINAPESLLETLSEISLEIAEIEQSSLEVTQEIAETTQIENLGITTKVDESSSFDGTLHIHDYEAIKDRFLEHEQSYNTIIISPEVYSSQDIDHIYHAYYLLNPGGSLAVTLPETVLAANNKLYSQFNKWLRGLKPTTEPLSDGKCLVMLKKTTLF